MRAQSLRFVRSHDRALLAPRSGARATKLAVEVAGFTLGLAFSAVVVFMVSAFTKAPAYESYSVGIAELSGSGAGE